VRTAGGAVFSGCNVENAAYPQGSCAETGAISAMVAGGERSIVEVVVVTDGEAISTCCGGCRQRIREFAGPATPIRVATAPGSGLPSRWKSCCRTRSDRRTSRGSDPAGTAARGGERR
jgi:cytidine deaminase